MILIGLEQKEVDVFITPYNKKHYSELGYDVTNTNKYISVKVNDLSHGSGIKVKVMCDYCGKIFYKQYRRYLKTKEDLCCDKCKKFKMMKSSLQKYGNVCSLNNPEISEKRRNTNMERYGCGCVLQNSKIYEKTRESFYKNQELGLHNYSSISSQQIFLNSIYGGKLNYRVGRYLVDIFFEEEKIFLEYDGGGHNLFVKNHKITQDEFEKREKERSEYIRSFGYKEFRIKSKKDKLLDKDSLMNIKKIAFEKLLNTDIVSCCYDIEDESWDFI